MQRHPEGCDPSSYHTYSSHRKPATTRERARNRASWDPALITLPGMQTALRELERLGPSLYRGTIPRHNMDRLAHDLTSILLTHVNQIRTQSKRPSPTEPKREGVGDDVRSSRIQSLGSKEDRDQPAGRYRLRRGAPSRDPTDEREKGVRQRNSLQHDIQDNARPRRRRRSAYYDDYSESEADEQFRRSQRPRRTKEIRENLNDDLAYEYIAEAARQEEDRRRRESEEAQKAKVAAEAVQSSDESEEEIFLKVVRPKPYVRERTLESDYASLTPISTERDDDTDTEMYRKWNARRVRKPAYAYGAQESSIRELCSIFPLGRKNRLVSDMLVNISLMRRSAAYGQRAIVNSSVLQRLPRIPSRCIVPGGWNVRDVELTHGFRSSSAKAESINRDLNRQHVLPAPNQGSIASSEKVLNDKGHAPQQAGPLPSSNRSLKEVSRNALFARRRPPMASLNGVGSGQGSGLLNAESGGFPHAALTSTQSPVNPGAFTTGHLGGVNKISVDNHLPLDRSNPLRLTSGAVEGAGNLQLAPSLQQSSDINQTQLHPSSGHGIARGTTGVMERQMQNRSTQLLPYGTVRGAHMDQSQLVGTPSANQIHRSATYGYHQGTQQSKTQLGRATGQISRSNVRLSHPHPQHYATELQGSQILASDQHTNYQRQMQNLLSQEQNRILESYRQRSLQQQQRQQMFQTQQYGHVDRRLSGQQRQTQVLSTPQLTEEGRVYQHLLQQQQSQMQSSRAQLLHEQAVQAMRQQIQLQNLHQQRNLQYPMQFPQNQAVAMRNNHVQTFQPSPHIRQGTVQPNLERVSQPQSLARVSDQTHQTKNAVNSKKERNSSEKRIPQTQRISSPAREHSVPSRTVPEIPIEMPEIGTEMEMNVLPDARVSSHSGPSPVEATQAPALAKIQSPATKRTVSAGNASYARAVHSRTADSGNITSSQEKNGVQISLASTPLKGINRRQWPATSRSAGLKNGYGGSERSGAESQQMSPTIGQLRDQMQERQRQYEEAYKKHYELQLKKVMEEFGKKNGDRHEPNK
ncbi:hypothetical protein BWQ96_03961 [Gracilariopsis chorda]|uniref:Uncharacterized protein n=1 Tax=Gracilariopsis chorda TaxID=448386 RepID=A0A2V3IW43_9FLOR|nr:hypothetical protein BWQ96_03961 [Gracilariopsis chorda]|eukprot:PXF46305.1 hypothetical protein BWQ96_03961 [Gracilariopsis chorda]